MLKILAQMDWERGPYGELRWGYSSPESVDVHAVSSFFQTLNYFLSALSILLSMVFAGIIVFCILRIREIRLEEAKRLSVILGGEEKVPSARWQKVLGLVSSSDPMDWRFAVLESDAMLAEIVSKMNYEGDTLAEKLESVEESDFVTIAKAKEAHNVRNTIFHHGSDFILTQKEAERIVNLYREVFEEFHYIQWSA
jgi:hypothetical protein